MANYRLTSESEDRRTGIKTRVTWGQDYKVVADYYRKDGSRVKTETLGYAMNEEGFMRLAGKATLM